MAIRQAQYCPISVFDLANTMAVSERTLNRKLEKLTGDTPKKCIDNVRISYACTQLNNANQSIKDIALALGYSEPFQFRCAKLFYIQAAIIASLCSIEHSLVQKRPSSHRPYTVATPKASEIQWG